MILNLQWAKKSWKGIFFVLLVLGCLPIPVLISNTAARCAYIMIVMSLFWILEIIPISLTACLPMMLFPFLGILSTKEACAQYLTGTSMLYVGGLFFATSLQDSKIHMRIAMKLLLWLGSEFSRVVLGFMLCTAFFSLWINNTACASMMIPIVEAVLIALHQVPETVDELATVINLEDPTGQSPKNPCQSPLFNKQKNIILLAVAFCANIGGIGILTGSGTNLVVKGLLDESFPNSDVFTFGNWAMYNLPGTLIRTLLCYAIFYVYFFVFQKDNRRNETPERSEKMKAVLEKRYEDYGPMTFHQISIIVLFLLVILMWFFRQDTFISGWGGLLPTYFGVNDTSVVLVASLLLFLIPRDLNDLTGKPLLEWNAAIKKIPWSIIFLLGGGFALAEGSKRSGLSFWIADQLMVFETFPPLLIQIITILIAAGLTQFVANAATASILLPMMLEMAILTKVNPVYYMLPITTASSFAFMLPAGTPPNAVAFEASTMKNSDMVKPGGLVTIMCVIVEVIMINTLGHFALKVGTLPDWAIRS